MHGELLPRNSEVTNLLQYACAIPANAIICESIVFSIYEGIDLIGFNQVYYIVMLLSVIYLILFNIAGIKSEEILKTVKTIITKWN